MRIVNTIFLQYGYKVKYFSSGEQWVKFFFAQQLVLVLEDCDSSVYPVPFLREFWLTLAGQLGRRTCCCRLPRSFFLFKSSSVNVRLGSPSTGRLLSANFFYMKTTCFLGGDGSRKQILYCFVSKIVPQIVSFCNKSHKSAKQSVDLIFFVN